MQIQKFLHSCLVIEEKGERLVVDPGGWSSPVKEIGPVDTIVITHEHQDHLNVDKIKEFLALKSATIIANRSIAKILAAEKISCEIIEGGASKTVGAFTITGVVAPHGDLPVPKPINVAYLINKILFITGDSLQFEMPETTRILTLPIGSPWHATTDAVALAMRLKPQHVIPVHEGVFNPAFATRITQMCGEVLSAAGIKYHPLAPQETLQID